jgi:hypothetical protein
MVVEHEYGEHEVGLAAGEHDRRWGKAAIFRRVNEFPNGAGNRDAGTRRDVHDVNSGGGALGGGQANESLGGVLDIQKVADLFHAAKLQGALRYNALDGPPEDCVGSQGAAIEVGETGDHDGAPEGVAVASRHDLTSQFAGRINGARLGGMPLVDREAKRQSINVPRGGINDASHAEAAASFQHAGGAQNVDFHISHRGGKRALGIGERGKVEDDFTSAESALQVAVVKNIAGFITQSFGRERGRDAVEDDDPATGRNQ